MILVDTCVLIDVAEDDDRWGDWSAQQLARWSERGPLVINSMIFAEWSSMFGHVVDVDRAVLRFGLTWQDPSHAALFLAAQAHKIYRRRAGTKALVLADFIIGAHAADMNMPILTRDPRRFTNYFAGIEVVCPPEAAP